jgi:hypothetical protein
MGAYAKRMFAATSAALLLTVAVAGPAAADSTTAPGPGICGGPPGQSGLVETARAVPMPPGQIVSYCNLHGHPNAGGGGVP